MSKKHVDRALEAWRAGRQQEARAIAASVEPGFVQKRLRYLQQVDGAVAAAATHLLKDLFGCDKGASSTSPVTQPTTRQAESGAEFVDRERAKSTATAAPARWPEVHLAPALKLAEPQVFLSAIAQHQTFIADLKEVRLAQIWTLVGLGALARQEQTEAVRIDLTSMSKGARFAHALGIEALIAGQPLTQVTEPQRTVPLQRVSRMDQIERSARRIAELMAQGQEDSRKTLNYIIVELLRNAVQHSQDPLGGVIAAQLNDDPQNYPRPVVQVAVADTGVGILQALRHTYPELQDGKQAIVEALKPHVSGTFARGGTGSTYNAGMGLFFIAELAKLSAGRLLIATRGATYALLGDPEGQERHDTRWVGPDGLGFPGTLVSFELPLGEVRDHESLLETVRERASQRTPNPGRQQWLRLQDPPPEVKTWLVHYIAEDVTRAEALARNELHPRVIRHESVALDFRGMDLATQSFLHALLFETLRLAWALRVEVYAYNAVPAVLSGLKLVDAYAVSG